MNPIIAVILVLGVLIFFHELGHFLVARMVGVQVLRFSLGFGPRLFGFNRGGTDYCLSLIPLGGYVKLLGENPNEPLSPKDIPYSFSHRPLKDRVLIVLAGPVANFVLAWILFSFVFLFQGRPYMLPAIGNIMPDSPAAEAGLKPGDLVLEIDGHPVKSWDEMAELIRQSEGKPLKLLVKRKDKTLELTVTPKLKEVTNIFGEKIKVPLIGITAAGDTAVEKLNPLMAVVEALVRVVVLIKLTLLAFVKLIERVLPLSTLGGPIFIAQLASKQAQQGIWPLAFFTGVLSVNLGVLNLLPIPVLDGGHLFFYAIEAIRGKPLSMRQREVAQQIGLALLITLMLVVFYNDILRLLHGG